MTAAAAAPEKTLVLPDALSSRAEAFTRALATPVPWVWNEDGPSFIAAEQPAAIGKLLQASVHSHLLNRKIGFLFREKLTDRGAVRLAQASKVSGKVQHYSGLDFLVEVNHEAYKWLAPARKIALIDHELCHFEIDDDKLLLKAHDLEEFSAIVRRWGAWTLSHKLFRDALDAGPQFDLFLSRDVAKEAPAPEKKGKRGKGKPTRVGDVQVQGVGVALT